MRKADEAGAMCGRANTHSLFNLAEFLELLAEGAVVGVPGKATVGVSLSDWQWVRDTDPMKSFVDMT